MTPELPVVPADARQGIVDEEHLRLLAIGHYVTGALWILFSSIFIFLFLVTSNPEMFPAGSASQAGAPDAAFFRFMGGVLGFFILMGWTFGGLLIYFGRCVARRTHRTLGIVLACFHLACFPVGTILGVATLMVLTRPSVKRLYASGDGASA